MQIVRRKDRLLKVFNVLNGDEIPKQYYVFHILTINPQYCVLSKCNKGSESFDIMRNELKPINSFLINICFTLRKWFDFQTSLNNAKTEKCSAFVFHIGEIYSLKKTCRLIRLNRLYWGCRKQNLYRGLTDEQEKPTILKERKWTERCQKSRWSRFFKKELKQGTKVSLAM